MRKCEACAKRRVVISGISLQADVFSALFWGLCMLACMVLLDSHRGGWHVPSLDDMVPDLFGTAVGAWLYYVIVSRIEHSHHAKVSPEGGGVGAGGD